MLHLQTTRAGRRAAEHASTHSAVKARRPVLISGVAAGAVLGISLLVGFVPSSAAGAVFSGASASTATSSAGAVPLARIAEEATVVLAAAQSALANADAVTEDVAASELDLGSDLGLGDGVTSIDTTDLRTGIDELSDVALVPPMLLIGLTADVRDETREVADLTTTLRAALTAAEEKAAAEKAAAEKAAAEEAARAEAARAAEEAAALAAVNTVDGAKATAQVMAAESYGWGAEQFSCLDALWTKESGWNSQAANPGSGAYGIPQALPGDKMANAGADWQTNAATQISWGLGYISSVYGTPCAAWSHSQATNWY